MTMENKIDSELSGTFVCQGANIAGPGAEGLMPLADAF